MFSMALLHGGGQVEKTGPDTADGKKHCDSGSQLSETLLPWTFLEK